MQDHLVRATAAIGEDDRLRAILEDLCRLTDMGFAAVARVTDQRWIACQVVDRIEFGLQPGEELQIKTTICDDIRQSGRAIVIDSVSADERWRTHPTPIIYGFESYASFPIDLPDGSFFGTLCAIDPAPRTLSTDTIARTMTQYAARAAQILQERIDARAAQPG